MTLEIDGNKLRAEREIRALTQQQLAEKAGISLRQIAALEKRTSDDAGQPVRQSTLEKLATALGVGEDDITYDENRPRTGTSRTVKLHVSASDQLRFDLIKERYGLSMMDLVRSAPMLFVLAANASLSWRRQQQNEGKVHLDRLKAAMGHTLTDEQRAMIAALEDALAEEAGEIAKGKVFTPSQDDIGSSSRFLDWVDAVSGETAELELIGLRKVDVGANGISVPYNVCRGTLYDLAGGPGDPGADRAVHALINGAVRLDDIPQDLRGEEKLADRIAWLGQHIDPPEGSDWCIDTYPGMHPDTKHYATHFGRTDNGVDQ